MKSKWLVVGLINVMIVTLDQWTKSVVHGSFRVGESVSVIDQCFSITYVRNYGSAFGLFRGLTPSLRDPFLLVVPIIAVIVIVYVLCRHDLRRVWSTAALSLILAGAVGNLLNRILLGYVIDFLDFHWKGIYHWPAFNIADSAIVVGVGIVFLVSFNRQLKS